MGHVGAFADARDLVEKVGLILPAAGVLEVNGELMPRRWEFVREIEADVGEAGILLLGPEPEALQITRRREEKGHLGTVGMGLEIVDSR